VPKRNFIWILAIAATATIAVLVTSSWDDLVRLIWASDLPQRQPGSEFDAVANAYDMIREQFFREIEDEELRRAAVRGMVDRLDPFSTYVPYAPGKIEAFRQRVMGRQRGLGLSVEVSDGKVSVSAVAANSPAFRERILPGDRIVSIDDEVLVRPVLKQVQKRLAGEVGTQVRLVILRTADGLQREATLERREYPLETVRGLYRDEDGLWAHEIDSENGIAYVCVTEFVSQTGADARKALRTLDGVRGLVLDLRDNPGGLLEAAIELADMFLSEGKIARVISRQETLREYTARADGTLLDVPLVVLINARSASGAEIVAAALGHRGRAVLVGTRSRGKGCIQSMLELRGELGLMNLTTSEFLVGDDRSITRRPGSDVWGIDPHRAETVITPAQQRKRKAVRTKAESLPPEPATQPATQAAEPRARLVEQLLEADPQLARAVHLLKHPKEMGEILQEVRRAKAGRGAKEHD
jgi:carboxyl-terminal processing protease